MTVLAAAVRLALVVDTVSWCMVRMWALIGMGPSEKSIVGDTLVAVPVVPWQPPRQDGTRQALDNDNTSTHNILDVQRIWIQGQVQQHAERLRDADDPAVELPHVLLECQSRMVDTILAQSCRSLKVGCTLAVVGGIQINTPEGTSEYFVPLRFSLYNHHGQVVEDLLSELHNSMVNTATW
jgi:Limiting CO2-inducible proteins B/C beta carbonyic anhydrases